MIINKDDFTKRFSTQYYKNMGWTEEQIINHELDSEELRVIDGTWNLLEQMGVCLIIKEK